MKIEKKPGREAWKLGYRCCLDINNFIIFHVSISYGSFCTIGPGRQGKARGKRGKKGRRESRCLLNSSVFLDMYKEQSGLISWPEDRSSHCTVCLSPIQQNRPIYCSSVCNILQFCRPLCLLPVRNSNIRMGSQLCMD